MASGIATPKASAKGKGKSTPKPQTPKLEANQLASLLNEATERMTDHQDGIRELKQQRSKVIAEKRALSKAIKAEKRNSVKKDKVMARRSTWKPELQ